MYGYNMSRGIHLYSLPIIDAGCWLLFPPRGCGNCPSPPSAHPSLPSLYPGQLRGNCPRSQRRNKSPFLEPIFPLTIQNAKQHVFIHHLSLRGSNLFFIYELINFSHSFVPEGVGKEDCSRLSRKRKNFCGINCIPWVLLPLLQIPPTVESWGAETFRVDRSSRGCHCTI